MIPTRRLSGENCGNGVSYRVAICRKRLRVSRAIPRRQINPRLDGYSLTSPDVAHELITRQKLFPPTELAATVPNGQALIDLNVHVEVEAGPVARPTTAPEKAEET